MMEHPGFFERAGPFPLGDVAQRLGATLPDGAEHGLLLSDVRALADAGPGHVTFLDNRKYLPQLAATRASACLVQPAFAARVPSGTASLATKGPYRAFALALQLFYPDAMRPKAAVGALAEYSAGVHATARIEEGVRIEPGAVIGPEAWIGKGSVIAAGAVVGYRVCIGRDSYIGAGCSVTHALIGNNVILHAGVRVGQDGFGFAMGAGSHLKVPQVGRVIIQDHVEIGANCCIDRGALKDTVIGEGTKIDNLVQIGHNAVIGRHCVIVGQVGISGSAVLEDYVVLGGQSGVAGHLTVGRGSQVAGASHVKDSIPPGSRVVGTPARPLREWAREAVVLKRLVSKTGDEAPPAGADDND